MSSVTGSENIPSGSRLCVCVGGVGGGEVERGGGYSDDKLGQCVIPNETHNGRMGELYL